MTTATSRLRTSTYLAPHSSRDSVRPPNWALTISCCVSHDRDYWLGESTEGYSARLASDRRLRDCVIRVGEREAADISANKGISIQRVEDIFKVVAEVMYRAVRIGGAPCTGLDWRWGHGWPQCLDIDAQ